jgi:hypothetical protein
VTPEVQSAGRCRTTWRRCYRHHTACPLPHITTPAARSPDVAGAFRIHRDGLNAWHLAGPEGLVKGGDGAQLVGGLVAELRGN